MSDLRSIKRYFYIIPTHLLLLFSLAYLPSAHAQASVSNNSFETPIVNSGFQYSPSSSYWIFNSGSGVQGNGSAWAAPTAPNGNQTAFLQNQGSISQTVNFVTAGTYTLSFSAAQRACCTSPYNQQIMVSIDGNLIGLVSNLSTTSFGTYSHTFSVTAGNHVIALGGTVSSGDNTAFVDAINITVPDGICTVRDSGGQFLAPVQLMSQANCENLCNQVGSTSCQWKGQHLRAPPTAMCKIRGGAHLTLGTDFVGTEAQCQTACSTFASNAYRYCDWGSQRIQNPPFGSECRIRGGAGAELLSPYVYSSLPDCQSFCNQYSSSTYRTCQYGNTTFQQPPQSSRCEILGGAAKPLTPPFFGTRDSCVSRCNDFATTNVNRACWYGNENLHP